MMLKTSLLRRVLGGCIALIALNGHAATSPATTCAALNGLHLPASEIGLPTRGAVIHAASLIPGGQVGNSDGEYCQIVGVIKAVRDNTPDIRFEVNLPTRWNRRVLQMGGGGYSGELVTGTGMVSFAPEAPPLAMGYATAGDDSGHIGNSARAEFGVNDDAVVNFGYAHLKKTRDVALALIQRGYGRAPEKIYFAGGSTGGREGYSIIERFPNDYDGIIADAPALNFSGVRLLGVKVGQAAYGRPGGFVTPAQQRRVYATAMSNCDALDGVADGIISNVEACRRLEPKIIAQLRCEPNNDDPTCLTDAQLATLLQLRDGLKLDFPLSYGVQGYHGYNVFQGTNFSGILGLGQSPEPQPVPNFQENGYLYAQGDAYMKYFVTRDANFSSLHFDLDQPGRYQKQLVDLSATVGSMNPDMSGFIARGGKLITLQGLADEVISPNETIAFYRHLVKTYGQAQVDGFMRLYMVPGFQHGNGIFIPSWDALSTLDRWVTKGVAPETLIGTDLSRATNGRTRPLCRYPAFPRYSGHGNINSAASFSCTTS
jgi:hypothetical protein